VWGLRRPALGKNSREMAADRRDLVLEQRGGGHPWRRAGRPTGGEDGEWTRRCCTGAAREAEATGRNRSGAARSTKGRPWRGAPGSCGAERKTERKREMQGWKREEREERRRGLLGVVAGGELRRGQRGREEVGGNKGVDEGARAAGESCWCCCSSPAGRHGWLCESSRSGFERWLAGFANLGGGWRVDRLDGCIEGMAGYKMDLGRSRGGRGVGSWLAAATGGNETALLKFRVGSLYRNKMIWFRPSD